MSASKGPIRSRLRRVRAVILDVDGVLTDGATYWSRRGEEMKRFHSLDGKGLEDLRGAGVRLAVISGEDTKIVRRHLKAVGIDERYLGRPDKLGALKEYLRKHRLGPDAVAYVGDDVSDLECLRHVGCAISVPNAAPEVRRAAHYVTGRRGGDGAVREIADLLLSARKRAG